MRYSGNGGSTWQTFYYILNLQGDVVKLVDNSGAVCAEYSYDAWGKCLSQTTATSCAVSDLAEQNPIRYRGYYYDTETGWYYLQSRYYDPIVKRFINADSYATTPTGYTGCNMFAYCNNNPVANEDSAGHSLRPITTVMNDGGTGYFNISTDGDPGSNSLISALYGEVLPLLSPYVDVKIKKAGEYFWDNHEGKLKVVNRSISGGKFVVEKLLGVAEVTALAAINTSLGVASGLAFAYELIEDSKRKPITGYHQAWEVSIDVYIEDGNARRVEQRTYIYVWARNSPTEQFWFQCTSSYRTMYEYSLLSMVN